MLSISYVHSTFASNNQLVHFLTTHPNFVYRMDYLQVVFMFLKFLKVKHMLRFVIFQSEMSTVSVLLMLSDEPIANKAINW